MQTSIITFATHREAAIFAYYVMKAGGYGDVIEVRHGCSRWNVNVSSITYDALSEALEDLEPLARTAYCEG